MRLSTDDCWSTLRAAEHGVLCTVNEKKTVDAVPVCFAVVGKVIATPIDTVKPKRTTELGRLSNLERDTSATLLCDHWDRADWSQLWWVRAHLTRRSAHDVSNALLEECDAALRGKYDQYRDSEFANVIVFNVKTMVGWSGAAGESTGEAESAEEFD
jgi:PPOX class probable F420-dependent enzyme